MVQIFEASHNHKAVLNHVEFHPTEPWIMGAGGGDSGGVLAFWDRKNSKAAHKTKPKGHLQRFQYNAEGQALWAVGHGGFQHWKFKAKQSPETSNADTGK